MLSKALLFLLLAALAAAQSLDETAQALGRRVAARIPPTEAVRLTARNLSTLPATDLATAQRAIARLLRRRVPRQAPVAEVRLTLSENPREFLLIAEIRRAGEHAVEIAAYHPPAVVTPTLPTLELHLLWEQDRPILDALSLPTGLLILDPERLTLYQRRAGVWEPASTRDLDLPPLRDPRGRLLLDGDTLRVLAPGLSCATPLQPDLALNCDNQPAAFDAGRFTPGRNTLEMEGWPTYYSVARLGTPARPLFLLAGLDGRARLYTADQRPLAAIDDWNSDFAPVCSAQILAARPAQRPGLDTLTAFRLTGGRAVESSDPLELPGAVTALWPAPPGAVAVIRNATTGRYAAYSLTLDCGR